MSTPVKEIPEPNYSEKHENHAHFHVPLGSIESSDEEGTFIADNASNSHRRGQESLDIHQPGLTPAQLREINSRMEDDLHMLSAERVVSNAISEGGSEKSKENKMARIRGGLASMRLSEKEKIESTTHDMPNPMDVRSNQVWRPPPPPDSKAARIFKRVHQSGWVVRYFFYIIPVALLILVPILLGYFLFHDAHVGDVRMMWFCVWLMVVWLSLWAGRIVAKILPWPIGLLSSMFSNNPKKWRDMAYALEIPATLFFWWLAVYISFYPTMTNHHMDGNKDKRDWEKTVYKVILTIFIGMCLNFFEKICLQLIAISFHERTYEDRISKNDAQIRYLTMMYSHYKDKRMEFDQLKNNRSAGGSGAKTPMKIVRAAKETVQSAVTTVTDAAGKVAADFTGRNISKSTDPEQVVLQLLSDPDSASAFARKLFELFKQPGADLMRADDLEEVIPLEEERNDVFLMFDRDVSGDISIDEMEVCCREVGMDRKSIIASLKDLDSVIRKLNDVLVFIVIVVTVIVFVGTISSSTASFIASAGSSLLALSWLFSQTAQEFLASLVFVFVKHPFDVGDRVDIMVNGEVQSYFVKEIALMYTELKKMEGHVVQAPNSLLNTLFILNMRRSPPLAEAVPTLIRFGTTIEQIEKLQAHLTNFVKENNRDFKPQVLTELRKIDQVHEVTLNIVFFYKSNWQDELLRLRRRNKFMCCLMQSLIDSGIESSYRRFPGHYASEPIYLSGSMGAGGAFANFQPPPPPGSMGGAPADNRFDSFSGVHEGLRDDASPGPSAAPPRSPQFPSRQAQSLSRGDSVVQKSTRHDFSLGVKDFNLSGYGDAFDGAKEFNPPAINVSQADEIPGSPLSRHYSRTSQSSTDSRAQGSIRKRAHWLHGGRARSETVKEESDLEAGTRPPRPTPISAVASQPGPANAAVHNDDDIIPMRPRRAATGVAAPPRLTMHRNLDTQPFNPKPSS